MHYFFLCTKNKTKLHTHEIAIIFFNNPFDQFDCDIFNTRIALK